MMAYKFIEVESKGEVLHVVLKRPELRNAFHPGMISEITHAFSSVKKLNDVAGVFLSGEGKVFCSGADLNYMKEMVEYSLKENIADANELFDMFAAIWNCPAPVLTYAQGAAFGGALGFLACSDFVIAHDKTQYCFSEVKLGIAPAVISYFLEKKISMGALSSLMLFAPIFTSDEAKRIGLVHEIISVDAPDVAEQKIISLVNSGGLQAMRATKKLLRSIPGQGIAKAKKNSTAVIAARRMSAEGQQGLRRFLDKASTK